LKAKIYYLKKLIAKAKYPEIKKALKA